MEGLKTLDEIKRYVDGEIDLSLEQDYCPDAQGCIDLFNEKLRKEAIKWIKETEKGMDKNVSFLFGVKISSKKLNKIESEILIKWIKNFFGITGEDLK